MNSHFQRSCKVGCALAFALCMAAASSVSAADKSPATVWPAPPPAPNVALPSFGSAVVRLTDFGGNDDGKTLNTLAFEKGIAALSTKGGGRLVVPAGLWLTGPIKLASNIELHLEAGALIQFSGDHRLYPLVVLDYKGEKEVESVSPISGTDLENVAITGSGVIDGAGDSWRPVKKGKMTESQWKNLQTSGGVLNERQDIWWPSKEALEGEKLAESLQKKGSVDIKAYQPAHHYLRPKMLKLINCRKVLLEGVTFQNSPNWALHPILCEDVTIRGVTVRNPWYSQNGDGLDLESCRKAVVRDSKFDVGDDAICIKSGKDAMGRRIGVPTEDVLIQNCTVYHGHGGFTIGSEMSGGVRNIRVDNCLFIGTDVGLRFKSTRGRGGVVENVFISNIRMMNIPAEAISFNLYYGGGAPLDRQGSFIDAKREMVPVNEETPQFRNIYIEDVVCRGAKVAVVLQGLPEMPIRGVHLKNVSITADAGVVLMDAEGISLKNVEIDGVAGPIVNLFQVKDSLIDQLIYPKATATLVRAQGRDNMGVVLQNTDVSSAKNPLVLEGGATKDAFTIRAGSL